MRCDKARLKLKPGVFNRDQEGIDVAGKHIPETFRRAVLWCIKRQGILMPEIATRTALVTRVRFVASCASA